MASREKPLVIVTRKWPAPIERRMAELFDVRFNETDRPMEQPALVAAVREADVLVPTVTDRIDRAVIEQAGPRLKMIANYGNDEVVQKAKKVIRNAIIGIIVIISAYTIVATLIVFK